MLLALGERGQSCGGWICGGLGLRVNTTVLVMLWLYSVPSLLRIVANVNQRVHPPVTEGVRGRMVGGTHTPAESPPQFLRT